ncbi:MAG: hypothetical protein ACOCUI_04455, partial [bacterium]
MKNLISPELNNIIEYKNIVSSKHSPNREKLLSFLDRINECYREYKIKSNKENDLSEISEKSWNKEIKNLLVNCYESKTNS